MVVFARTFLTHAGWQVEQAQQLEGLEAQLRLLWAEGTARWPDIPLSTETFIVYLAERSPPWAPGEDLQRVLAPLHPGDLYLACACAQGLPAALAAFERHHMASIPATLAHMKLAESTVDDIRQRVRERLLVRTEAPPRITEYSGRGLLSNWVRVVAVRTALSQLRTAREEGSVSDAILDLMPSPGDDPEVEAIQRRYQVEFRQAMEEAFAALPSKHRYLLRLHFVDRLSTSKIGALFNVNQSTASRWLQSAQQDVHDETRRILKERLDLSSQEFTSLLRAVESQLNLSISRLLTEG
ncbi:sigma-70 family RNA polymerase sigma factor [Myxococcus sp. K15C18031901]|uniref:sigma-70 family RNA polymerase sigma factor n=1 Tax=Myxococcus dinghuensis TaxID=2906761 RepID=UPI0020A8011E|nr:sigma-70 family RNA polymerase sigma factor [Myxococcus dinghuensis]MCP3101095.1 sigma-70 family RNA polymerase sigma factor [Myxococcus dinghuensis]